VDDAEVLALLEDQESDRMERKASFSDPHKVRQAVCAFANDMPGHGKPGVVFIGVNPDGSCAKLPITEDLLANLAHIRDDGNIQPIPSITVQKRVLDGCEVAAVIVEPSEAPPVRYKTQVWIRVGPRRAIASAEEERRLVERRRGRDLPFDLRPVRDAGLEDLDLDLFGRTYLPHAVAADILARNDRTPEERLAAMRFTDPEGRPTVLGILTIGKDPRRHLPCAYVQFLRLAGLELTDPIQDAREVDGPLPDLLRRLEEVLESHNRVSVEITAGPVEIRRPEYPIPALQQLARNALLHRNYEGTNAPVRIHWFDDRIEILSPGGPFGQVTADRFGSPGLTDYRNPHLAEAMRVLGYVQRYGVGIPIARRELAANGNPPPEFEVNAGQVLATVRRRP